MDGGDEADHLRLRQNGHVAIWTAGQPSLRLPSRPTSTSMGKSFQLLPLEFLPFTSRRLFFTSQPYKQTVNFCKEDHLSYQEYIISSFVISSQVKIQIFQVIIFDFISLCDHCVLRIKDYYIYLEALFYLVSLFSFLPLIFMYSQKKSVNSNINMSS